MHKLLLMFLKKPLGVRKRWVYRGIKFGTILSVLSLQAKTRTGFLGTELSHRYPVPDLPERI